MDIGETLGESDGKPYRFYDIPKEAYPIDVEFIAERTGDVVHTIRISGPGVIEVPNLSKEHGPIEVVMNFRGLNEQYFAAPQ